MGVVNFVLIALGVVAMAYGYSRARGPGRSYQALKEQDANIARYESWRGGLRDSGTTGASVAMEVLRRAGARRRRSSWPPASRSRSSACSSTPSARRPTRVADSRQRTHGRGFATRAIHAGERPDPVTHAHNTPIYATATFAFDTAAEKEDAVDRAMAWDPTAYFYSRTAQPDDARARGEARLARRRRGRGRRVVGDGVRVVDAPRAPRAAATTSSSATSCS